MAKVGITYKKKGKEILHALHNTDFVSTCDGITFGSLEGLAFNSAKTSWSKADQITWAKANAILFKRLSDNLNDYAKLISEDRIIP